MTEYVLRHPRTHLLLAKKDRNPRLTIGSGFGQDYRWVRDVSDATRFPCFARAEEPAIFLNLRDFEIRPMLSCGLLGDPLTRDEAMANDTFHQEWAPRDNGRLPKGRDGTARCEASQSGAEGNRPNTPGDPQ